MIIELINEISCDFAPTSTLFETWVNAVATEIPVTKKEVCITLVDEAESAALNNQYRQKNYPTNVLSFHYDDIPGFTSDALGDLIICPAVVKKEAETQQKPLLSHFAHMTIHGTLHLLGYDHVNESDAEKMEALEIKIMEKLRFENPYEREDHV